MLMSVFTGAESTLQFIAVPSTKEALLARNWKRAEQGYSPVGWKISTPAGSIFKPTGEQPFIASARHTFNEQAKLR